MNAPETVQPTSVISPQMRRSTAREHIAKAREHLILAARLVDGDLEPVPHNTTLAITAVDDAQDALHSAVEADLRVGADAHGENAGKLAAEARGEL